jgi:hypothetical protein
MDRFNICQAYAQLEADYNVGGWLRERPSNQRRMESIGVQLDRMGFSNPYGHVDIDAYPPSCTENGDCDDDEVREVYMCAVLRLDLPIDEDLMAAMRRYFTADFMAKYPQTRGVSYKQGD